MKEREREKQQTTYIKVMRQAHKCRFHRHMERSKDADAEPDADVDVENNSGCCSQHMRLHEAPLASHLSHVCRIASSLLGTLFHPLSPSATAVCCCCLLPLLTSVVTFEVALMESAGSRINAASIISACSGLPGGLLNCRWSALGQLQCYDI